MDQKNHHMGMKEVVEEVSGKMAEVIKIDEGGENENHSENIEKSAEEEAEIFIDVDVKVKLGDQSVLCTRRLVKARQDWS